MKNEDKEVEYHLPKRGMQPNFSIRLPRYYKEKADGFGNRSEYIKRAIDKLNEQEGSVFIIDYQTEVKRLRNLIHMMQNRDKVEGLSEDEANFLDVLQANLLKLQFHKWYKKIK